jgi:CRISPR system Cascade subunit CasC
MKIECHILQNFPPHCLNRDDTNSPKDCEFGGVRRARISSQCLKRAARDAFEQHQSFTEEQRAVRTKRIVEQARDLLVAEGRDPIEASGAIAALLTGAKLKTDPSKEEGGAPKTQYLLFLPSRKIAQLAAIVQQHWDVLVALSGAASAEPAATDKGKAPKPKSKAKDAADVPKEAKAAVLSLLKESHQTPEIALFGRMVADNADWNVEAACQVAHAISTHRVSMEFDFYTAVDDLKKESETGSDMMGTIQFNSACFYRYAVIDTEALAKNLGGTEQADLVATATKAFLEAFVHARPTGKQNSMAANTLPSLVLFTVRDGGEALSLANAFVQPVTVQNGGAGLVQNSAKAMAEHFSKLMRMYPRGLVAGYASSLDEVTWDSPLITATLSVDSAVEAACEHLKQKAKAA